MKLITGVIQPAALDTVKEALALFGVRGMTITPTYRSSNRPHQAQFYRGRHFTSTLEPSLKLELVVPDEEAPDLLRVIEKIVTSLSPGEDHIFTSRVELLVRVRTGERGHDAL
jgi:nitrogen regulatory protein PII